MIKRFHALYVGQIELDNIGLQGTPANDRWLSDERLARSYVATGNRLAEEGDLSGSLPWLVEAMRLDAGNREREAMHRVRVAAVLRQIRLQVETDTA